MSFASVYAAGMTKPLIRQLLAVIQRDIQAALDYVSGTPGLYLPFKEYHLSEHWFKQLPAFMIVPISDRFDNKAVGSRKQLVDIELLTVVGHQDKNFLAEMVQDYVRAVDAIITGLGEQVNVNNTPNFSDFYVSHSLNVPFAGSNPPPIISLTTTPLALGVVTSCLTTEHRYDHMVAYEKGFKTTASVLVQVTMEET